jgi:hypothetical protein
MKRNPSSKRRRSSTKSVLRLPDLEHAKAAVLHLPGVAGYMASLLRRFHVGTRRVSPVALHVLIIVLSL